MRILNHIFVIMAGLFLSSCFTDGIPLKHQYDYKIAGLSDLPETKDYLDKILKEQLIPPPDDVKSEAELKRYEAYLERRVESSLIKALHAKGFYDAEIKFQDTGVKNTGAYEIIKGDQYMISEVSIKPKQFRQHIEALTVEQGSALTAVPVLKSQAEFYEVIQKDECYFNLEMSYQVVLDRKVKTGRVIYDVEAGPKSVFGKVYFKGHTSVEESYLRKLIPFKEGDCFRREKIEKLRGELLSTGLFARADIKLPDQPVDGKVVPLDIDLKERAHRTVRVGASFYTDEGLGGVVGWEHRNFLGSAEKLEAKIKASQRQQQASLDLTKPFFIRKDQTLSLTSSLEREDSDAFDELSIGAGASIARAFTRRLSGSTGVELKISQIEGKNTLIQDNFALLSFPHSLTWDSRNDKLNARKGWFIKGTSEPFLDMLGNSDPFFKNRVTASTYFGFEKNTVFAVRASVGSIQGADIENVPATERFYAGGGGSVRGFGYQEVGPFMNGDPSGGASIVEGAAEIRYKLTDTLGVVGFVDAGKVDESPTPEFGDFSIGAGVGVRYYSSFGPLRLDVATPLTDKGNADSSYQIYISIGQAF